MIKVLITGGAGFIGSHFARYLLESGEGEFIVTVLDSLTYSGNPQNIFDLNKYHNFQFVLGSILDLNLTMKLVHESDIVVNFAAESHVDNSISSPVVFYETNLIGTINLLESVRASTKSIRFVQISTDEVYGSISVGAFDEKSALLPSSPYSSSKAAADLAVISYVKTYAINACITRTSNNFGPYQYPEKLIPLAITNILRNKAVPIYGDGKNVREWISVYDNCKIIAMHMKLFKKGTILNIGTGFEKSNIEIIQSISELLMDFKPKVIFVPDRKGHDFRYSISTQYLKKTYGNVYFESFEESLSKTVDWYIANSNWWLPITSNQL